MHSGALVMLLLGLRQLPSLAQIREGQAGGAKGKKGKRKQVAQDKAQALAWYVCMQKPFKLAPEFDDPWVGPAVSSEPATAIWLYAASTATAATKDMPCSSRVAAPATGEALSMLK